MDSQIASGGLLSANANQRGLRPMKSKLPTRPRADEVIKVVISADEKREVFATAAARRTSVSEFVRRAIRQAADAPTAA